MKVIIIRPYGRSGVDLLQSLFDKHEEVSQFPGFFAWSDFLEKIENVKKINQKKYLEALNFAFKLHSKQFRKGTKIPYFFHLSSVSNHVIENGGDTDEAIAGLLHDAVEDQGGEKTLKLIKKKFGNKVAKIVEDCTDTKVIPKTPWFARKKQYISDLKKKSQSSLLVSICDKTHNASCLINDFYRVG